MATTKINRERLKLALEDIKLNQGECKTWENLNDILTLAEQENADILINHDEYYFIMDWI